MDLDLTGKVAFLTGGGELGEGIARALADEGCVVAVADRVSAAAERVAAKCRDVSPNSFAVTLDVGDPVGVQTAVSETTRRIGAIDILVNGAGVLKVGRAVESSVEDWEDVCRVNLSGVLNCIRAVAPEMVRRRRGRIINIASISAMRGSGAFGNTLYGTTKAGVAALTMGFARELGPSGITVNAVAPGAADTPMTRPYLSEDRRVSVLARIPLGRFATPMDIGNMVSFLASDRADYVTGAVIPVDGGILTT